MSAVSVLIPAYNASGTLLRALDSVHRQKDVDVEVCICLNGSEDEIAAMRRIFAAESMVVGLYTELPGAVGAAGALNEAAALAKGRYFIELDADDVFWDDTCLSHMVETLENSPSHVGFVYGNVEYNGDAEFVHTAPPFYREIFWHGNAALYPFLYRREAWDSGCRYYSLYYDEQADRQYDFQDWDMLLQLTELMRYDGVALPHVNVLRYTYRQSGAHETARPHHVEMLRRMKKRWPMLVVNRA